MRIAAENRLREYPGFVSVDARAESTALLDRSVDFITAGQAFHWFEPEPARQEYKRILKPDGWIVIVENIAQVDTPFLAAYHQFCAAYLGEKEPQPGDTQIYQWFFHEGSFTEKSVLGVCQGFDFKGLLERVLSRAAAPEAGHPGYPEMLVALRSIFDRCQQNGEVVISYETRVVYGQFTAPISPLSLVTIPRPVD